ncbi:MAG: alpha/beta hydrolase fold domain-containing protein [Anaerolineales bacterium]|jgi:acetyl esterase/lipase
MIIVAYFLAFVALLLNGSLFVRLRPPWNFMAAAFQIVAVDFSPFLIIMGLAGAALGWLAEAPVAVAAGLLAAAISAAYIYLVVAPQPSFELAFGEDWKSKILPAAEAHMLKGLYNFGWPRTGEPRWERDVAFWTVPGTERKLLCDIWQPPEGVPHSGLALVFLHGGAWWILDKDFGTRPLFRHLAAQGHVIMDVAYRLCPEVDIHGMLGDVKRAVAWMKQNAGRYEVNPERVVLGGGSAGGHLALLAAYTPDDAAFNPSDVAGQDLSVRGVISLYGPTDLHACYLHFDQTRVAGLPKIEVGLPEAAEMKKTMTDAGRLDTLLGGHLHEVPEAYEMASPVTHVRKGCPPTLLIQGEPDVIQPAPATRVMYLKLVACGTPAVNIIYPLTNHAFDLLLPQVSPPAHAALYYIERFLALMT